MEFIPIPPDEDVEKEDPLFGNDDLPDTMMFRRSSRGLFSAPRSFFTRKHIEMKLDYLPSLFAREFSNPELAGQVFLAEQKFNELVAARGKKHHELIYGDSEHIYSNNPEMQAIMRDMALVLKGSDVRDCIELSVVLSNELLYFTELVPGAGLWDIIEDQLDFNLHILSFEQRAKAMFGLTHKFPKKCSFGFRERLVTSLLKTNFSTLSPTTALMFATATRNMTGRDYCHYKFFDYLMGNMAAINQSPIESSLPVDALYTFFNCRINPGKRKRIRFEYEEEEEEVNVLEKLSPAILDRIPNLGVSALFRLLSALSIARVKGYTNLEFGVSRALLRKLADIDLDVLVSMLVMISDANRGLGFGDKDFWDSVQAHVQKHIQGVKELPDKKVLFDLMRVLAQHNRLELGFYQTHFAEAVESTMQLRDTDWDVMYNISVSFTRLALNHPDSPEVDLRAFTKQLMYAQRYWKFKHHNFFQTFRLFVETKHPSWNLSAMDYFGFHSDKQFQVWDLKKAGMSPELKEVLSITQTDFDMQLIPQVAFRNCFLLDLANENYRFAVFLRTDANTLSSQKSIFEKKSASADISILREMQKKILRNSKWHVFELDFEEYLSKGTARAEWLKEMMQVEFAKAIESHPDATADVKGQVHSYINAKGYEEIAFPFNEREEIFKQEYDKMKENFEDFLVQEVLSELYEELLKEEVTGEEGEDSPKTIDVGEEDVERFSESEDSD